jgi:hypothetical protein
VRVDKASEWFAAIDSKIRLPKIKTFHTLLVAVKALWSDHKLLESHKTGAFLENTAAAAGISLRACSNLELGA